MKKWILVVSAALALTISGSSIAVRPIISLDAVLPGPTPFISFVTLRVTNPANLATVKFSIRPKQGSKTRPISATYSATYLTNAGYFKQNSGKVTVPVFGLYEGRQNSVTIVTSYTGGTGPTTTKVAITTPAYDGGPISNPTVVQARSTTSTVSYDYILMKNSTTDDTPAIIDSDAEVRWIGMQGRGGQQALFYQNAIYSSGGTTLVRLEFDGRTTTLADYASLGVTGIHHNFDYGRDGILIDVDTTEWIESTNMEVDGAGNVLRTWDLADIISAAMVAGGDDPSLFVFPSPVDWFHNNATSYRPSDDSFVVSSRENFVIALDYDTQAIKWILGDSSKHWHEFRSLRKFQLRLGPDTLAPIGEHALSWVDDELLMFDNGTPSLTQVPAGDERTYSAPRKYSIQGKTATEVYHYLASPPIKSAFCSSVYEDAPDNYLIDYAMADSVNCDIVGLDSTGAIAFFYQYVADGCGTAWNANILHLENLTFN